MTDVSCELNEVVFDCDVSRSCDVLPSAAYMADFTDHGIVQVVQQSPPPGPVFTMRTSKHEKGNTFFARAVLHVLVLYLQFITLNTDITICVTQYPISTCVLCPGSFGVVDAKLQVEELHYLLFESSTGPRVHPDIQYGR